MIKRKIVSPKNLPMRAPVGLSWLSALSQTVWSMPGWLVGVMWTFNALIWALWITDALNRKDQVLFATDEDKQ